jgi:long-subunit fatty acid transport protein
MNRSIVVAAVLAGMSSAAAAQDFQVGARAKAMGGSYTAFGDDPVAVWTNPAGTATQSSQFAITYQSFTEYEFNHVGDQIVNPTPGRPGQGLLDPPISPSFVGVVVKMGEAPVEMAASFAYIRPFQIKYVYSFTDPSDPTGNSDLITQTDQQFSRIRVAYGASFHLSEASFFKTVAIGAGLDFVYTNYKEIDNSPNPMRDSQVFEDSKTSMGYGVGLLVQVYDSDSFRVDFGAAYNSKVHFHFGLDTNIFPVWDWPALASGGFAFYIGEGYPLRITLDTQWIGWESAVGSPDPTHVPTWDHFRNTYSFSAGAEYRFKLGDKYRLFARAGVKSYDTPWKDRNNLPAVGASQLTIETKGDRIQSLTLGLGFYWLRKTAEGETRTNGIDFAIELLGETKYLFGVAFNYQFD